MYWNSDHSKEGGFFLWLWGWKGQLACNKVVTLKVKMLVKDDLVHCLAEVLVDFVDVLHGFI